MRNYRCFLSIDSKGLAYGVQNIIDLKLSKA